MEVRTKPLASSTFPQKKARLLRLQKEAEKEQQLLGKLLIKYSPLDTEITFPVGPSDGRKKRPNRKKQAMTEKLRKDWGERHPKVIAINSKDMMESDPTGRTEDGGEQRRTVSHFVHTTRLAAWRATRFKGRSGLRPEGRRSHGREQQPLQGLTYTDFLQRVATARAQGDSKAVLRQHGGASRVGGMPLVFPYESKPVKIPSALVSPLSRHPSLLEPKELPEPVAPKKKRMSKKRLRQKQTSQHPTTPSRTRARSAAAETPLTSLTSVCSWCSIQGRVPVPETWLDPTVLTVPRTKQSLWRRPCHVSCQTDPEPQTHTPLTETEVREEWKFLCDDKLMADTDVVSHLLPPAPDVHPTDFQGAIREIITTSFTDAGIPMAPEQEPLPATSTQQLLLGITEQDDTSAQRADSFLAVDSSRQTREIDRQTTEIVTANTTAEGEDMVAEIPIVVSHQDFSEDHATNTQGEVKDSAGVMFEGLCPAYPAESVVPDSHEKKNVESVVPAPAERMSMECFVPVYVQGIISNIQQSMSSEKTFSRHLIGSVTSMVSEDEIRKDKSVEVFGPCGTVVEKEEGTVMKEEDKQEEPADHPVGTQQPVTSKYDEGSETRETPSAMPEEAAPSETPAAMPEEAAPSETPAAVPVEATPSETPAVSEEAAPSETPSAIPEEAAPTLDVFPMKLTTQEPATESSPMKEVPPLSDFLSEQDKRKYFELIADEHAEMEVPMYEEKEDTECDMGQLSTIGASPDSQSSWQFFQGDECGLAEPGEVFHTQPATQEHATETNLEAVCSMPTEVSSVSDFLSEEEKLQYFELIADEHAEMEVAVYDEKEDTGCDHEHLSVIGASPPDSQSCWQFCPSDVCAATTEREDSDHREVKDGKHDTEIIRKGKMGEKLLEVQPTDDRKDHALTKTQSEEISAETVEVPTKTEEVLTETEEVPTQKEEVPTETEEVPTETDEMPTVTEGVPTEREEVPLVTDKAPSVTEEVPTETDKVPSVMEDTTTETEEEPTETEEVPTETEEVPTETDEMPSVTEGVPTEREEVPLVTDKAPSVTEEVPTETDEVPSVMEDTPTETEEVPTETEKAPTETEVPSVTEEVPTETDEVPSVMEDTPTETEEVPTETEKAPTETEVPSVTEEVPTETDEVLTETEEVPSVMEDTPTETEEVPTETEKAPTETEVPSVTEEVPTETDEVLTETEEVPSVMEDTPTETEEVPTETEKAPTETEVPSVTEEVPTETDEVLTETEEVPSVMEDTPTETEEVPTETEKAPTETEVPSVMEDAPTETEEVATKTEQVPMETEEVPTETEENIAVQTPPTTKPDRELHEERIGEWQTEEGSKELPLEQPTVVPQDGVPVEGDYVEDPTFVPQGQVPVEDYVEEPTLVPQGQVPVEEYVEEPTFVSQNQVPVEVDYEKEPTLVPQGQVPVEEDYVEEPTFVLQGQVPVEVDYEKEPNFVPQGQVPVEEDYVEEPTFVLQDQVPVEGDYVEEPKFVPLDQMPVEEDYVEQQTFVSQDEMQIQRDKVEEPKEEQEEATPIEEKDDKTESSAGLPKQIPTEKVYEDFPSELVPEEKLTAILYEDDRTETFPEEIYQEFPSELTLDGNLTETCEDEGIEIFPEEKPKEKVYEQIIPEAQSSDISREDVEESKELGDMKVQELLTETETEEPFVETPVEVMAKQVPTDIQSEQLPAKVRAEEDPATESDVQAPTTEQGATLGGLLEVRADKETRSLEELAQREALPSPDTLRERGANQQHVYDEEQDVHQTQQEAGLKCSKEVQVEDRTAGDDISALVERIDMCTIDLQTGDSLCSVHIGTMQTGASLDSLPTVGVSDICVQTDPSLVSCQGTSDQDRHPNVQGNHIFAEGITESEAQRDEPDNEQDSEKSPPKVGMHNKATGEEMEEVIQDEDYIDLYTVDVQTGVSLENFPDSELIEDHTQTSPSFDEKSFSDVQTIDFFSEPNTKGTCTTSQTGRLPLGDPQLTAAETEGRMVTKLPREEVPTESNPATMLVEQCDTEILNNAPEEALPKEIPAEVMFEESTAAEQPKEMPVEQQPKEMPVEQQPDNILTEMKLEESPAEQQPKEIPVEVQPEEIPVEVKSEESIGEQQPEEILTKVEPEEIPTEVQSKETPAEGQTKEIAAEEQPTEIFSEIHEAERPPTGEQYTEGAEPVRMLTEQHGEIPSDISRSEAPTSEQREEDESKDLPNMPKENKCGEILSDIPKEKICSEEQKTPICDIDSRTVDMPAAGKPLDVHSEVVVQPTEVVPVEQTGQTPSEVRTEHEPSGEREEIISSRQILGGKSPAEIQQGGIPTQPHAADVTLEERSQAVAEERVREGRQPGESEAENCEDLTRSSSVTVVNVSRVSSLEQYGFADDENTDSDHEILQRLAKPHDIRNKAPPPPSAPPPPTPASALVAEASPNLNDTQAHIPAPLDLQHVIHENTTLGSEVPTPVSELFAYDKNLERDADHVTPKGGQVSERFVEGEMVQNDVMTQGGQVSERPAEGELIDKEKRTHDGQVEGAEGGMVELDERTQDGQVSERPMDGEMAEKTQAGQVPERPMDGEMADRTQAGQVPKCPAEGEMAGREERTQSATSDVSGPDREVADLTAGLCKGNTTPGPSQRLPSPYFCVQCGIAKSKAVGVLHTGQFTCNDCLATDSKGSVLVLQSPQTRRTASPVDRHDKDEPNISSSLFTCSDI